MLATTKFPHECSNRTAIRVEALAQRVPAGKAVKIDDDEGK
jgi:hypothetical protein